MTDSARRMVSHEIDLGRWEEFDYYEQSKKVLHIEMRKHFDAFVIAPLSANTLGKISNGLCDNVLTNVARCWDYRKSMILAPAMNTYNVGKSHYK